jgi:RimJ/RimL family protein N-acetyltransferase
MNHNIRVEGLAYSLRPVQPSDAQFILDIRSSSPERQRYLHAIGPSVDSQRTWIDDYLARENDYYWVIERKSTGNNEGLIGIYDVDQEIKTAEWGRWILRPSSLGAVESALLIYRAAFQYIKLNSLYCITVADNKPVVSFHDSCGLPRIEIIKNRFSLADGVFDGIKHQCNLSDYPALIAFLEPKAKMINQRLSRSK